MNQRLFYKNRGNLMAAWVVTEKITIGKVYPAIRYEKKGSFGSSPPVIFEVQIKNNQ